MTAFRRREPRRPEVGPNWLWAFADLIALLLAVFVLLYAGQKVGQALLKSLSWSAKLERPPAEPRPSAVVRSSREHY
jgi:flagellar motor protein MotB